MQNEFKIVPITNKRMIDMTGETYGRLTVLGLSDKKPGTNWVCQCTCGEKTIVLRGSLTRGLTSSCGCYKKEQVSKLGKTSKRNTSHGETGTRLYRIWTTMKQRCNNPNNEKYSSYGDRNIKIYDEWSDSYEAFAEWARSNGYEDDLSIDRIDNDDDYKPSNCHWATPIQQGNNRRDNVLVEYQNEEHTFADWARITGIHKSTLKNRYDRGDRGDHLFRPTGHTGKPIKIEYNGETHTISKWSKITGINKNTLSKRYQKGDRGDHLFRPVRK